jgi:type II secretory pathway pseudopilin PulG
LLLLLVAVLLVGVAGAVVLGSAQDASDLRDERDDREEVQRLAGAFGEAYLSYDFQDVDASGDRVLALVTEAFAADFEDTRAPGIEAVFATIETTTVARTTDVYVGDIGEDTAQAYVIVDVDASNDTAGQQTLRGLSFLVSMAREDGEWKVDTVSPPPSPDVDGASSTTTTSAVAG